VKYIHIHAFFSVIKIVNI